MFRLCSQKTSQQGRPCHSQLMSPRQEGKMEERNNRGRDKEKGREDGAKREDGKYGRGGESKERRKERRIWSHIPFSQPEPTGESSSALPVIQRGHIPSTLRCCLGAPRLQTGEMCKQFVKISSGFSRSCPFPGAILFLAALREFPPHRPQPGSSSPPSPPFPQLSKGARVSLMRSGLCLSHPSRVAG